MNLTRKDFFRKSLYSLGKTVLAVGEGVREAQASLCCASGQAVRDDGQSAEPEIAPGSGGDVVAKVDNLHCMAKNCGCFSCVESCSAGAISLAMGEGVRIDAALCTGCGDCFRICPLAPQALRLVPRG